MWWSRVKNKKRHATTWRRSSDQVHGLPFLGFASQELRKESLKEMKPLPIYSPWIPPGFMRIFWEKHLKIKKKSHPDPPVIKDGNVEHSPIQFHDVSYMFPCTKRPGFHFHGSSSSSSLDTWRPSDAVQSRRIDQHWTPLGPWPDPNRASYLDTWPWSPEESNHFTALREDLHWKPGFVWLQISHGNYQFLGSKDVIIN